VSWDGNNGDDCHEKFEGDAGSLVSFVEIKFSKVDATTVLSNKEINDKLRLMKKHSALENVGIDVKDVVWVAAALRHVVENKKIECDFPGTVLIFNREELLNWLGPTFRNLR
jgi:spore maturation protein CgeB